MEKGKPSCVDSQPVNLKRTEFAFDGDSDRLIAVDENGEIVDGYKKIGRAHV